MFGRERFSIELQRPYWRGDARRNRLLDRAGRRGCGCARFAPATPTPTPAPGAPTGRAGRDPVQHHPRGQRGGTARQPRVGAAVAGRDGRPAAIRSGLAAPSRWPTAAASTSPRISATAIPTSLERRRAGAGRARPHLQRRARAPLRRLPHIAAMPEPAGRGAAADRAPRPGRLLPAARRDPGDGTRGGPRGARPERRPPAAPARPRPRLQRRLDRLLPDRPVHVDPIAARLFLGRFLSRTWPACPTSTSTSPATSARG